MSILELDDVSVGYRSVMAVEGVSFNVERGDFFCIVGENGSGKSSLVRCALGLAPLSSGAVRWSVSRDKIAYVPQVCSIDDGVPATVGEIVLTGTQRPSEFFPLYTVDDRELAAKAMRSLDIAKISSTPIGELSGGQTRRVLIARALCREPEVVILDEPCAGLDESIAEHLETILAEMHSSGLTIIMVSHDLEGVRRNATRVAVLHKKLLFCGAPSDWEKTQAPCQCGGRVL